MTFLYLSCIEIALIYLLNIPKELFKRYIGMSLFVNGVVMMISSSLLLQDILFLESLCFFLFYSLKRRITEILFYLSFLLVVKDIIIIFPFYTLISFIIYMTVMALLVYIKQRYPIDNQNIYWSLLMMISLSTLCIYHILYYDFLEILGVNRHLIILTTLVITMMISYYMFFKYTKLNHEQQLLNQAITYFKVDPFAGFYVKAEYSERRYLSASELQAVMDVRLPNYRTGINRDAFVFCAFTGLSHADVVKLTHTDIHTDDNGERWIIDKRQKTGTQFRVKLLPAAEMLYKRYKDTYRTSEKVFPLKGTYKTLNMSLRHVARHAGLSFNPTIHMARHTFATTVTLTQGVPLETVSKMLGHKRITTTQIYARITNDKIGQDMAALSEKLDSVFKIAQ